jgi:DNA topoisomerase-1
MFLKSFFSDYIEYEYTAKLEDELDLISDGKLDKLDFLNNFWKKFKGKTDDAMATELLVVSEKVSNLMNDYIFSGNFKNIKK